MNMAKHRWTLFIHKQKLKSIVLINKFLLIAVKTINMIILKDSKGLLNDIKYFLIYILFFQYVIF
jgi:hypothetical protein